MNDRMRYPWERDYKYKDVWPSLRDEWINYLLKIMDGMIGENPIKIGEQAYLSPELRPPKHIDPFDDYLVKTALFRIDQLDRLRGWYR